MVEAAPGSLITCNPGEVHDGMPLGGARRWKMLYLRPSRVAAAVSDIREGGSAAFEFMEPVMANRLLAGAFEAAYGALTDPLSEPAQAEEHLIGLLARLLRPRTARTSAPPMVARVKARIDEQPIPSATLAELAREAGVSRYQLLRGFARSYGLTPHAYMVQRRLDVARRLIATGAALAEAASDCGFADQSHLSRLFVRRYGLTPGAYAEAMGVRPQFRSRP